MMVCMSGVPLLSGRRKRPDRSASASDPRSQYCCTPAHVYSRRGTLIRHSYQREQRQARQAPARHKANSCPQPGGKRGLTLQKGAANVRRTDILEPAVVVP